MQIRDLLPSPTLAELLQMRLPVTAEDGMSATWFSVDSAAKIWNQFQMLDVDKNGHLSSAEFAGWAPASNYHASIVQGSEAEMTVQDAGPQL
jgi:hypothetical protein